MPLSFWAKRTSLFQLTLSWCYTGRFLTKLFNVQHCTEKKTCNMAYIYRRFLTQHLLPQRVAQFWTDFECLQRCCNKLVVMLHGIDFSRNNVALKIVQCMHVTSRVLWYFVPVAHGTRQTEYTESYVCTVPGRHQYADTKRHKLYLESWNKKKCWDRNRNIKSSVYRRYGY